MAVTRGNIVTGMATIEVGTAGTNADSTTIGSTQDGAQLVMSETSEDILTDQGPVIVKSITDTLAATVTFNILETTLANLSYAMQGSTVSGSALSYGDEAQNTEKYLTVTGLDTAGSLRIWQLPYVRAGGDVNYTYTRAGVQMANVSFSMLAHDSTTPLTITDGSTLGVTISSDAAIRTAANATAQTIILSGESATDDDLANITGATTLVNGEILKCFIAATTMAITYEHSENADPGFLELDGSVDWTAAATTEYTILTYNLGATKWEETGRLYIG